MKALNYFCGLVAVLALGLATNALAQAAATYTMRGTVSGVSQAKTITSTSTTIVAAGERSLIAIANQSPTATISCAFGIAAVINGAGSWDIPAGSTRVWDAYPIPNEAMNCISSAATSPASVQVF